jgi:hypothetical protein
MAKWIRGGAVAASGTIGASSRSLLSAYGNLGLGHLRLASWPGLRQLSASELGLRGIGMTTPAFSFARRDPVRPQPGRWKIIHSGVKIFIRGGNGKSRRRSGRRRSSPVRSPPGLA